MESVKIVIADDNAELRRAIADFMSQQEGIALVGQAGNGIEALEQIQKIEPDVLISDLIMPQMDGYTLMERLNQLEPPKRPEVIALTALGRDDFIMRAVDLGARYYMVKPFDLSTLYQRVMEIVGQPVVAKEVSSYAVKPLTRSLDEKIASLFLTVGIPAHIKGYQFLREAVKMVMDQPEMINRITKELYPGIARKFSTTASKVERAIRHAIEVAWARGRSEVLDQIFGPNICSVDNKPTNGEFIALVADKLSLERTA